MHTCEEVTEVRCVRWCPTPPPTYAGHTPILPLTSTLLLKAKFPVSIVNAQSSFGSIHVRIAKRGMTLTHQTGETRMRCTDGNNYNSVIARYLFFKTPGPSDTL